MTIHYNSLRPGRILAKCKIYCGRTRKKERRPLFLMLGLAANNKKRMVFMETIINDLVEILKSDTDSIPIA